jgi:plastocyanin
MKRAASLLAVLATLLALSAPVAATAAHAGTPPARVALTIKSDTEHAKKGPDGKWHDAYLPARFTVHSGARVTVTIRNYDDAPHTFTSPGLHLNVKIKPGSASKPSLTTFTFIAPKAGKYVWTCTAACDPWAMTHYGFMLGRVTVVA